jgi:hypothetical protein
VSIIDRISRKPRAEVTLPLAEWHATTLAIDGLVDHNDELQRRVDDLTLEVAEHCGTIQAHRRARPCPPLGRPPRAGQRRPRTRQRRTPRAARVG